MNATNNRRAGFRILTGLVLIALLLGRPDMAMAVDESDPTILATDGISIGTDGNYVVWSETYGDGTAALLSADIDDHVPWTIWSGPASLPPYAVDISDGIAVWQQYRPDDSCCEIRGADLATHKPLAIETGTTEARNPAVSGNIVVWVEQRSDGTQPNIVGRNLITGEDLAIATTPADETEPLISGNRVAWKAVDGNTTALMTRDLTTDDPPVTIATYEGVGPMPLTGVYLALLDGDQLFWVEVVEYSHRNSWLVSKNVDGTIQAGASLGRHSWSGPSFDAVGNILVYARNGGEAVVVQNLLTGNERILGVGGIVATDGRYVFWREFVNYPDRMDLMAYDTQTGSRFIVRESANGYLVSARGGVIVWTYREAAPDFQSETNVVHATRIESVLPSSPRPDPGASSPNWTWYPETGHYLSAGFRDYWSANGGLSVFGYPMTEEYHHWTSETDDWKIVQFTERQRFEWHPENAGTPYEVLLGRLGAELLVRQGRDWTTFPMADPTTPHYVDQTGHAIDARFWEHWSGHGLDLGDPGVSERESVSLFGYPLSEAMVETNADGDTVLTQYFERAVFELHPGNEVTHQVLLRRLGAETLSERGW